MPHVSFRPCFTDVETGFGPIRFWCFMSKLIETKGAELSIIRYFIVVTASSSSISTARSCLNGNEFNEQESKQGITSAPLT